MEVEDNDQYALFVDKFTPKKTTDDCYTPPEVYETIKNWACEEYSIDPETIVRPFYPGGNYKKFDYPDGCTVLDNPPFSILSEICNFYINKAIKFFLFAPSLTCFSGRSTIMKINHLICDCEIIYDNGARVKTSFVTSYGGDIVAQTAPELTRRVNKTVEQLKRQTFKALPKYKYPDHIITAAIMQKWSKYGVEFSVRRHECAPIYQLDSQVASKTAIFGGGLILAERAAAERAAAVNWELSDREWEIVKILSKRSGGAAP